MEQDINQPTLRRLRGLAHKLAPVVQVGQKGITDAVLEQIKGRLADHELIKIKLAIADRKECKQAIADICTNLDARLVQSIGKTATLYRAAEEGEGKHSNLR